MRAVTFLVVPEEPTASVRPAPPGITLKMKAFKEKLCGANARADSKESPFQAEILAARRTSPHNRVLHIRRRRERCA
jgi:hypothetical protein